MKCPTATRMYHSTAKNVPATNMPLKCHMPKLLDVHLWKKHANIYATYEVAPINDVARITTQMMTMTMMMMQDND